MKNSKITGVSIAILAVIVLTVTLTFAVGVPDVAMAETPVSFAAQQVKVGFFAFEGYHIQNANGARSGYGYEYLQNIARYANLVYEYDGYDWSWEESLEKLKSGEIDLLTSATKTPERETDFLFSTSSIGTKSTILTVKNDNEEFLIGDYSNYGDMRVGFLTSNFSNKKYYDFAYQNGFGEEVTDINAYEVNEGNRAYFASSAELCAALQDGNVDAIVTSNLRVISNENVLVTFDPTPYYVITRNNENGAALMDKINYAINQLNMYNPTLQAELYDRYYSLNAGNKVALTVQEMNYIEGLNGNAVKALVRPDNAPYSSFVDGVAKGIIVDVIKEIFSRSDLTVEFVYSGSYAEYENLAATRDDILIKADAVMTLSEAEEKGYKLTDSYLRYNVSELRNKQSDGLYSVAAIKGSFITDGIVASKYAASQIRYYATAAECIEAVSKGDCDVTYLNTNAAEYAEYHDKRNRLSSNSVINGAVDVSLGVKSDAPIELLTILNKSVDSISNDYLANVVTLHTQLGNKEFGLLYFMYNEPALTGILFTLILIGAIAIIYIIFRSRNKHLLQEKNFEFERFISYVCKANSEVWEIDISNNIRYEYSIEEGHIRLEKRLSSTYDYFKVMMHPDDFKTLSRKYYNFDVEKMNQEDEIYFEARILSEGEYKWYLYTFQKMTSDKQHPNSCLMYKKDISAAKAEEALRRQTLKDALKVAQQASAAKGFFLSRMSHEIRTPLNAVISYIELAKEAETKKEISDYVDKSQMSAKHLLSIINDVLDISSIESGKIKIDKTAFDFKSVLNNITTMFYAQAKDKGVDFDLVLNNVTHEYAMGDQLRVSQVIINLLSNAVKFTPKGGSVTLDLTQTETKEGGINVCFKVSDTGCGMDKAYMKKIFEPFEQESASTALNYGGTGLGLAITKNLVEMMSGAISVESEKGVGSTFTVNLPFDIDSSRHVVGEEYASDYSHLRALVVDDESSTCKYISLLLSRCGVECTTATTGKKAVECVQKSVDENKPFDLCIIDWKMPDFDGMQTVKSIRKKADAKLPVIIATAYDFSEVDEEAKKLGVQKIVNKPLFQSTMLDLLA